MANKFQKMVFKRDNASFDETFAVNIPNWLFAGITEEAAIQGISRNALVKNALRQYLAHRKPKCAEEAEKRDRKKRIES